MRIVALSDQHGYLPEVPACDLLIVAGDVCPDGIGESLAAQHPEAQKAWFDENARPWLAAAPATHKVLTWGNHDWCGQACDFKADSPATAPLTTLQILVDTATLVPGTVAPARSISVWGTPWSRTFMHWAFMKSDEELAETYAAIPTGVDILVSHQPPYGFGDDGLGSPEFLAAIKRVRPRLVICGHIHAGYGQFEYEGIPIYNVSLVNDQYRLVRLPTVIDIGDW